MICSPSSAPRQLCLNPSLLSHACIWLTASPPPKSEDWALLFPALSSFSSVQQSSKILVPEKTPLVWPVPSIPSFRDLSRCSACTPVPCLQSPPFCFYTLQLQGGLSSPPPPQDSAFCRHVLLLPLHLVDFFASFKTQVRHHLLLLPSLCPQGELGVPCRFSHSGWAYPHHTVPHLGVCQAFWEHGLGAIHHRFSRHPMDIRCDIVWNMYLLSALFPGPELLKLLQFCE